eukprot:27341-Prymnesium_polylepis.1
MSHSKPFQAHLFLSRAKPFHPRDTPSVSCVSTRAVYDHTAVRSEYVKGNGRYVGQRLHLVASSACFFEKNACLDFARYKWRATSSH